MNKILFNFLVVGVSLAGIQSASAMLPFDRDDSKENSMTLNQYLNEFSKSSKTRLNEEDTSLRHPSQSLQNIKRRNLLDDFESAANLNHLVEFTPITALVLETSPVVEAKPVYTYKTRSVTRAARNKESH
jgi:hypothetical protein